METEYQIEDLRKLLTENRHFILSDAYNVLKDYSNSRNYIIVVCFAKKIVPFLIKLIIN